MRGSLGLKNPLLVLRKAERLKELLQQIPKLLKECRIALRPAQGFELLEQTLLPREDRAGDGAALTPQQILLGRETKGERIVRAIGTCELQDHRDGHLGIINVQVPKCERLQSRSNDKFLK